MDLSIAITDHKYGSHSLIPENARRETADFPVRVICCSYGNDGTCGSDDGITCICVGGRPPLVIWLATISVK